MQVKVIDSSSNQPIGDYELPDGFCYGLNRDDFIVFPDDQKGSIIVRKKFLTVWGRGLDLDISLELYVDK